MNTDFLAAALSGKLTEKQVELAGRRIAALIGSVLDSSKLHWCKDTPLLPLNASPESTYKSLEHEQRLWFGASVAQLIPWISPELVLPLGFDEVRYGFDTTPATDVPDDLKGLHEELEEEMPKRFEHTACRECVRTLYGILYRGIRYRRPNGTWHVQEHLLGITQPPADRTRTLAEWTEGWLDRWTDLLSAEPQESLVTLPELWIPDQPFVETLAHASARSLLAELQAGTRSLQDLHWRQLEELVAELLSSMGLEVSVTKESGDGGRDVLARGELIPGEPMVMAVEVKHMPRVGLGELREALWANRNFPALLLATSGQFSAGVIREKRLGETALRLYLKDGVALEQWMGMYSERYPNTDGRLWQPPAPSS